MKKTELIQAIITETGMDGVKWFDFLQDKSKRYLEKFLMCVRKL